MLSISVKVNPKYRKKFNKFCKQNDIDVQYSGCFTYINTSPLKAIKAFYEIEQYESKKSKTISKLKRFWEFLIRKIKNRKAL